MGLMSATELRGEVSIEFMLVGPRKNVRKSELTSCSAFLLPARPWHSCPFVNLQRPVRTLNADIELAR